MTKDRRTLWHFPWRYGESVLFIAGITCVGFLLQIIAGYFDFYLLHKPVNYLLAGGMSAAILLTMIIRKNPLIQWLSGIPFTVSLLGFLLILTIMMGFIPQVKTPELYDTFLNRLGFLRITSSWPFVMLYALLLFSLGLTTIRPFFHFRKKNFPFVLTHGGLWFVLMAAGFGAADMQQHIMHVTEKETEWRVYDDRYNMLELPVAIKLNDFDMEEYPPKLMIVNRDSGMIQPEGRPQRYQVNMKHPRVLLGKWDITINEYIPHAVWGGEGTYRAIDMPGSAPAVNVKARHLTTGNEAEGWVWGDPSQQFMKALTLEEPLALVITRGEPKRFISDIAVATKDGWKKETILEVNKPLRIGSWMVYQYGYNQRAGKYSTYSSFMLVYDPWLLLVYLGLFLMTAGALALIFMGKSNESESSEEDTP